MHKLIFLVVAILLSSCARSPIKTADSAMRPTQARPPLTDDLGFESLHRSLVDHIRFFQSRPQLLKEEMTFGPRRIAVNEYVRALQELADRIDSKKDGQEAGGIEDYIAANFEFFEVYGQNEWGDVFITSYFEPVLKGSKVPTAEYFRPIYRTPPDMLTIKIDEYANRFPHWSIFNGEVTEQKSRSAVWRGRLVRRSVIPYFDRREIDSMGLLRDPQIELAYADPIDVFVLQIQGSGVIELSDGSHLRIGYAAQNGYPYFAIGKVLLDRIPKEKMSLQAIERELRAMPFYEAQSVMNQNPSYVFFDVLNSDAVTSLGTPVRPGRTIATDRQFFPKGALAFLMFEKPVFANESDDMPARWEKTSRFVMDQDTGGAIRGPGRLDLYWGRGKEARRSAGVMKNRGRLYYLVPKEPALAGK